MVYLTLFSTDSNIGEIHYHTENKTNGGKQIEFSAESNQFEKKKSKVGINEMFSNCKCSTVLISKSKLRYALLEKVFLKIEQKTFVLLLIKRRHFFGTFGT